MGIKCLNRFLSDRCSTKSICKTHLKTFRNKTIVIDTSIYLYKFAAQDAILENFELMIAIFSEHKITPIFIFDGKAPTEKRDLLRERSRLKKEAEQEYNELQLQIEQTDGDDNLNKLKAQLQNLKMQMTRIRNNDIQSVKNLFDTHNVQYQEAVGEADQLCVQLVLHNKAWACMSDDMDMFVYGCPRVLRHFSLRNKTILYYDLPNILKDLKMSQIDFRQISVISGTDYNIGLNTSLHETIRWYYEYKRRVSNDQTFYDWLYKNTKYITNLNQLNTTYNLFCLE